MNIKLLHENINKIHTTNLGRERISKNLNLENEDVISWCKNAIKNSDNIILKGKNYYVYYEDSIITINKNNFSVITAHKNKTATKKEDVFDIKYATLNDKAYWFSIEEELSENEFDLKVRDQRAYIILCNEKPIGIMRYNLMWDVHPFLTLIHLEKKYMGKGFGKKAMLFWEEEMKKLGFRFIMTSTMVNDTAQHFYRKLGYIERGSLFLDNTPISQEQEMFMVKTI